MTMNQELISYFDEHFRAIDDRFRSMDERLSETNHQIHSLREVTNHQIQSLREETNLRFDQVAARFDKVAARFDQVAARFDQVDHEIERVETRGRHTQVLLEGLRHETHLIAEGVYALDERLESHRKEVALQFEEIRDGIKLPYKALDIRVSSLEGWRELTIRDPIELIRERFPQKAP